MIAQRKSRASAVPPQKHLISLMKKHFSSVTISCSSAPLSQLPSSSSRVFTRRKEAPSTIECGAKVERSRLLAPTSFLFALRRRLELFSKASPDQPHRLPCVYYAQPEGREERIDTKFFLPSSSTIETMTILISRSHIPSRRGNIFTDTKVSEAILIADEKIENFKSGKKTSDSKFLHPHSTHFYFSGRTFLSANLSSVPSKVISHHSAFSPPASLRRPEKLEQNGKT